MYILVYISKEWSMNITQNLQKWGNSSGVRLPKKVVEAAKLKPDQPLEISLRGRSIVLTPVQEEDNFTLKDMLKGVTPENMHPLVNWGPDVGAEIIEDGYSG
jgi:antitoxin MazE